MSNNSEMVDAKETPLAAVIDDSCTVQYIEITPLDRPSDDCYNQECIDPVVEVKPEDLQDVKQEPADETDSEVSHYSVKREVSSDEESSADDVHFPVSETDSHMQPVVVLERLMSQTADENIPSSVGERSFRIKTEDNSNDITEHPCDDKPMSDLYRLCDKGFIKKEHWTVHSKRHTGGNLYSCTQCEKRFLSESGMYRHMNIHSGKYKCTECGKCCAGNEDLAIHRRSHSGEKPLECTVCGKRFTQTGHLLTHSRSHSGEKPYKCRVCDKAFNRSEHLKRHLTVVHSGEKPYKCSLCCKRFIYSNALRLHDRRIHSNRRPYHCPHCEKLFKTNTQLKYHVRIHTGAKPYSCRHCSKCFRRLDHLKRHLLKLHNEVKKQRVHWQCTRSTSATELQNETNSGSGKRKRAVYKFTRNLYTSAIEEHGAGSESTQTDGEDMSRNVEDTPRNDSIGDVEKQTKPERGINNTVSKNSRKTVPQEVTATTDGTTKATEVPSNLTAKNSSPTEAHGVDKDWDFCRFLYHNLKDIPEGDVKAALQLEMQQLVQKTKRQITSCTQQMIGAASNVIGVVHSTSYTDQVYNSPAVQETYAIDQPSPV